MVLVSSCFSSWLDIKPDKKMVLPAALKDVEALLDNTQILNVDMPNLGEVSADDYFMYDDTWQSLSKPEYRNAYIWAESLYEGRTCGSWNNAYQAVFYTNLALESLDRLPDGQSTAGLELRGAAHFFRAWAYFQLAQLFCDPYDGSDAGRKAGLPLRLESDIGIPSVRSSIRETYDLIQNDLARARELLPETQSIATRPSRAAAYGLSAIFYLQKGDYTRALQNAEECLSLYNELLDYNAVGKAQNYSFKLLNKEVIFHSSLLLSPSHAQNALNVDPELYSRFDDNDLRKDFFFRLNGRNRAFIGSYNGNNTLFNGIATDEIMLIRAECLARSGKPEEAMTQLNHLLVHRYKDGTYREQDLSGKDLLDRILLEKRKQLVFRGRRWWELRRLNKDPEYAKVLRRQLSGETYELNSNSRRYTLPFPDDVIRLSEMEQNPR